MRKMFTRLLGLTLLVSLFGAFSVVKAQDCTITESDVRLVTDPADVCDGQDLLFEVVGYPGSLFAFNYDGNAEGGFSTDSTVSVPEGTSFTVQVEIRTATDTCMSNILTVLNESIIEPVQIEESEVEQPLCYGQSGEITIMYSGDHAPYTYYIIPDSVWQGLNLMTVDLSSYQVYSEQIIRPEGSYWVSVQDANSCIDLTLESNWDSTWVDPAPAQIAVVDVNGTDPECIGAKGLVTVSGISGGTPYPSSGEYLVTVGDSTKMSTGQMATFMMPAGSYKATVVDTFGCSLLTDSVAVLTDPAPIEFDIAIDDITCADSTDGAIYVYNITGPVGATFTATVVGADTAFYGVTPGSGDTITISGLTVGYYSLWVDNTNDACDSVAYENPNNTLNTISLQAPGEITYDVVIDTVLCYGGTSTITVANEDGGTGTYEYSINGVWGTTKTWDVVAGSYDIAVRDAGTSSCEIAYPTITLTDPAQVAISSVATVSPTCPGGNDGVINITATAETGRTLEYSIDSMAWYTNNIFAVPAGDYTVYVRDMACEDSVATEDVAVKALEDNVIVIASKDTFIECYGADDASVTIAVDTWADQTGSDNRTAYIVMTDDPAELYVSGDSTTTGVYTNLSPGTYYFWAIDNLGCQSKNTLSIIVTEEDQLEVMGEVTGEASCYGQNDGVITLKMLGGTTPFKYGHANTVQAAMNLASGALTTWPTGADSVNIQVGMGTYYVVVQDGCNKKVYAGPFEVDGLEAVTIAEKAVDITDIICKGDSIGEIVVAAATGGTEELVYTLQQKVGGVWEDVEGYVDVTETTYSDLKAGTYKVVVTDLGGCDGDETGEIVVKEPASEVAFTAVEEDITCNGANDGKITVTASGGVGKYQFKIGTTNWRDFPVGSDTKVIVVTEPGDYTVWVRDSVECTAEGQDFTIDEPAAIELDVVSTASTDCDDSNGKLSITVTGGRVGSTYTIEVNDSTYTWVVKTDTTYVSEGLSGGDYKVTATESHSNGCYVSVTETVDPPVDITYSAVIMDSVHCRGGNDGIIVVSDFAGGLAPYVTTLSGPVAGTKTIDDDDVVTFADLVAGEYEVTVTDANGCPVVKTLSVSEPDTIILAATWDSDISCVADGQFSVQASGGSGQFVYYADIALPGDGHVLLPDPMVSDAWQTDSIFTVDVAGTYVVWAYDTINGCMIGGEKLNGVVMNEWRVKVEAPEVIVTVDASVSGEPKCYGDMTAMVWVIPANITIVEDGVTLTDPKYTVMIDAVDNDTIKNVGAGTYVVKVTHESGCYGTDTVKIEQPDMLDVVLDKGEGEFTCPDVVQGYIEATADGGTTVYEYQLWQDDEILVDYQSENSFLVEIGHNYQVVVKDANACTDTSDVMVLDPVAAVEIVDILDVTCSSDTLASALVTITGEPGRKFQIYWEQTEAGFVDTGNTDWVDAGSIKLDQIFEFDNENIQDIHYDIWVVDTLGCVSEAVKVTFDQVITTPLATTVAVGEVDDCATEVMVSATGGVSPYMVVVNDMDTTEFEASATLMLPGGTHTVDIYDAHLCMTDTSLTIDYVYTMDSTYNIYVGDSAHVVYEPAMFDTMLVEGEYVFYPEVSAGCVAEVTITVNEREKTAPVLESVDPRTRIYDNHPTFTIVFEDNISFNETGYLTVTKVDSTEASLVIEITPDMFHGDSLIVTYVASEVGSLELSTKYFVEVDSGVVMGDGLVWDGFQGDNWKFNTGPNFPVNNDPVIELTEFSVYPNPFNDRIYIDNHDKLTRVVISNIAGQRVMDVEFPESEIQTSNLVSGIYLVRMFTEEGLAKTDKIVKR